MADLSLESPAAFRLVAAAAAMVGSLALVALGVQIGTDGIGGLAGADRNPASATASPAAAVVALPRSRPVPASLDQTLLSLVPLGGLAGGPVTLTGGGLTGFGSTTGAGATTGAGGTPGAAPAPGPSAPSEPAPTSPVPVPVPTPTPAPVPVVPVPVPGSDTPILEPLAPVLDPLVGATLDPLGLNSSSGTEDAVAGTEADADATEPPAGGGLLDTLTGLLGL